MIKQSLNLLLVESDPVVCRQIERTLAESEGAVTYFIEVARDLKIARQFLRSKDFDSVLLDMELSDSTGLDTLISIKKVASDVPVVVLSSVADHQRSIDAIKAGADQYLVKGRFMKEMLGRSICYSAARVRTGSVAEAKKYAEEIEKNNQVQERLRAQVNELGVVARKAVAERDQLKGHLSKLKRQFDAIFNSIPSMIWLRGLDGQIITSNKKARQFFYECIRDVEGNDPNKIFTEVLGLSKDEDEIIIASGCPLPSKLVEYVDEDGQKLHLEVDRVPYCDEKGEITGILVYVGELPEVTYSAPEPMAAGREDVESEVEAEVETVAVSKAADEAEEVSADVLFANAAELVDEDEEVIDIDVEFKNSQGKSRVKKILIVDDDPLNQMLMNLHLNALGVDITTVDNGQKAVEKIRNEAFDLIFMDIRMPVLDGKEATQMIRQMGVRVPIIAATTDIAGDAKQTCIDAGCDDFICKPIIKKEFYALIHKYLDINVPGHSRSRVGAR